MAFLPLAVIVCFLPLIHSNSFKTQCTLPGLDANYVSGPDVRSTLDIFWSSVATIFLCTWTVLHLNIPEQSSDTEDQAPGSLTPGSEPQEPGTAAPGVGGQDSNNSISCRFRSFRRWLSRKPKWMLVTIILPEFLVGKSMADYVAARRSARCTVMQQRAQDAGIEWTMTHAFYANMGGFILKNGLERTSLIQPMPSLPKLCAYSIKLARCFNGTLQVLHDLPTESRKFESPEYRIYVRSHTFLER
ncbi:hypothetical protein FPCIR_8428 [Fusarium pseudocircinatum]|uniref:Uncharacterized protein n=1 Tax=Fusarium pseudocircinatum TaxID=56676 RepID=A0A8H5P3J1_9HYPO|nr:hypothetical protein FPCIR_8428 [Fusarium pseudocircinatum]